MEVARQERDAAWHRHRAALDARSADAFADAMAAHDRLLAGLAEAATRSEAARAAGKDVARLEAKLAAAAQAVETARTELAARDLSRVAETLGLAPDASPDSLSPRLDHLREIARARTSGRPCRRGACRGRVDPRAPHRSLAPSVPGCR